MSRRHLLYSAAMLVVTAALGTAQNIAPAHSGTVHYFDGDVSVDGVKLVSQVARFTDLKEQSVLHTGMGRAEILLTPGVVLRVGENTSVKMLDNRLVSTRLEFLSGTAMVESIDSGTSVKDPAVTIIYKDFEATAVRNGIFEMTSQPGQLRVFKGEARVTGNGASVNVKEGNLIGLTMTMATAKFDAKEGDDLYLWSRDRSAYLAAGNMSSARALATSGYGASSSSCVTPGYTNAVGYVGSGYGYSSPYIGWNPAMWNGFSGGWYYNQCLNMYSYMPFAGTIFSPFGYGFYNPVTIGYVYAPNYYWAGAGGAKTGTTTGLPLQTLAPTSTTRPTLPRLGTTATVRPALTAATRTTQGGLGVGGATFRSAGGGQLGSGSSVSSAGSTAVSARTAIAAPAAGAVRGGSARR